MSKLHNLSDHIDDLPVRGCPLDAGARDRILARAYQKAGLESRPAPKTARRPQRAAVGTCRPRRWAAGFAVAAAIVAASLGVAAVGPTLLHLKEGKIDFFADAPATAENALDAPIGNNPVAAAQMAAHTAEIGQSVTQGDLTITLDSVSMDAATLDVFFTLQAENLVPDFLAMAGVDTPEPDWSSLMIWAPGFMGEDEAGPRINGEACCEAGGFSTMDFYRVDDNTIKIWRHFLLTDLPEGDSLTITMTEPYHVLGHAGCWTFSFTLDAAEVRAGGRAVQPGVYDLGQTMTIGANEAVFDAPLRLERLAFGPGGGVLVAGGGDLVRMPDNRVTGSTSGWEPGRLAIADDAGRPVYLLEDDGLTALAPDAAALTLTPVLGADSAESYETRTVTTAELAAGVDIQTSPLGGYTIRNFAIKGSVITWDMTPYGEYVTPGLELSPDDAAMPSVTEEAVQLGGEADGETLPVQRTALASDTVDTTTGARHCRIDYYVANEEDLRGIETWSYLYAADVALDTDHALTLPLQDIS